MYSSALYAAIYYVKTICQCFKTFLYTIVV